MSSLGHKIPTTTSSDRYADEASQVILRAFGGQEGDFIRHEPKANIQDIIKGVQR